MEKLTTISLTNDFPILKCLVESCGEDSCAAECERHNNGCDCENCGIQEAISALHIYQKTGLIPEQITDMQAENERLEKENEAWNNKDCNTCPLRTQEACDEICESRKSLTQRLADITSERDRWKARAEKAEAERDAAIKDIKSVSQCETCAYAGNNPFDGSEYFRCSLGSPCVEGSGFKWRGISEREENHEQGN